MFTRILTKREQQILVAFLKEDAKPRGIGVRMWRIRHFTPQIKEDLALMEKALAKYEQTKKKSQHSRLG
jgi:hypothetical protein